MKYRTPKERLPEYPIWLAMRQRCNNQNNKKYPRYGGRGIKICQRWNDFWLFLKDMSQRPSSDYSIERVNNDGNYEPDNCIWKLKNQQQWNTSKTTFLTYKGVTKSLGEWAYDIGIPSRTLYHRLYRGRTLDEAMTADCLVGRNHTSYVT